MFSGRRSPPYLPQRHPARLSWQWQVAVAAGGRGRSPAEGSPTGLRSRAARDCPPHASANVPPRPRERHGFRRRVCGARSRQDRSARLGLGPWDCLLGDGAPLVGHGRRERELCGFLGTVLSAGLGTGCLAAAATKAKQPLRGTRTLLLVVLLAVVPIVFDPHTGDVFNIPKYTAVVIGALALAGLWAVSRCITGRSPTGGMASSGSSLPWWPGRQSLPYGYGRPCWSAWQLRVVRRPVLAACFGVVVITTADASTSTMCAGAWERSLSPAARWSSSTVSSSFDHTRSAGRRSGIISWKSGGSFSKPFFSTFGNLNHLGGYLAMVLPVVLVLGLGAKRWFYAGGFGLLVLAISRSLYELRPRRVAGWHSRASRVGGGPRSRAPTSHAPHRHGSGPVWSRVAAVGMTLDGKHFLAEPLSTLFQSGGNAWVEQRFANLEGSAAHRPRPEDAGERYEAEHEEADQADRDPSACCAKARWALQAWRIRGSIHP